MWSVRYAFLFGQVAQLVEQRTENPCVGGSIPSLAINRIKRLRGAQSFPFSFTYLSAYLSIRLIVSFRELGLKCGYRSEPWVNRRIPFTARCPYRKFRLGDEEPIL